MTIDVARPPELADVGAERMIELDVRADLREGREPFGKIMEAKDRVPENGVLVLRAIFEPVPLYRVMEGHGFERVTRKIADDDWVIWFRKVGGAAGSPAASSLPIRDSAESAPAGSDESADGADVIVLDVRGMEPPEPMVRTLAALDTLAPDQTLVQVNVREPRFLLPKLEARGFRYEVRRQKEGVVRVFIRHGNRGGE